MKLLRCLILTALGLQLLFLPVTLEGQQKRGAFALHYGPALTATELAWYGRFDVLVTHDPLPAEQVRELHKLGTKLFFYEWSVAFYDVKAPEGSWERSLLRRRKAVLNRLPLQGGFGSSTAGAFYFDPADGSSREARARVLAARMKAAGYNGIFLDTTTFASVHPEARAEYLRRHPGLSYDAAFSRFLRRLDDLGVMIFTNQGFQAPQHFLPYSDWDLSESLITFPRNGQFVPRPWYDPNDRWNSSRFILEQLVAIPTSSFPNLRVAHLNYIDGSDRDAIHLVLAASWLFGASGYVVAPDVKDEQDEMYFFDPGAPISARVDANDGNVSYRSFRNALIAINGGALPFKVPPELSTMRRFKDLRTSRELKPGSDLTIPPATAGRPSVVILQKLK
ncbi:MAG TPA: hypothetical protein VNM92_09925 [Thermoanaerobaculia bacterium]|nr:hypothetical protein [Thermoanaerobaculia bacterium]